MYLLKTSSQLGPSQPLPFNKRSTNASSSQTSRILFEAFFVCLRLFTNPATRSTLILLSFKVYINTRKDRPAICRRNGNSDWFDGAITGWTRLRIVTARRTTAGYSSSVFVHHAGAALGNKKLLYRRSVNVNRTRYIRVRVGLLIRDMSRSINTHSIQEIRPPNDPARPDSTESPTRMVSSIYTLQSQLECENVTSWFVDFTIYCTNDSTNSVGCSRLSRLLGELSEMGSWLERGMVEEDRRRPFN